MKVCNTLQILLLVALCMAAFVCIFAETPETAQSATFDSFLKLGGIAMGILAANLYCRWWKINPWLRRYEEWLMEGDEDTDNP